MLKALCYARSSYFYRKKADKRGEFYADVKEQIRAIFKENYSCYGYRRIYLVLNKRGVQLSEKVIRRLMKQEHLQPQVSKKRVYSSYQGEITPAVPNVIARNFHMAVSKEIPLSLGICRVISPEVVLKLRL